jgi:hypothetical protein
MEKSRTYQEVGAQDLNTVVSCLPMFGN